MKIGIEDLRETAGIVGQAGGAQTAIVVQFVVDLAVMARFTPLGSRSHLGKRADSCGFGSPDTAP